MKLSQIWAKQILVLRERRETSLFLIPINLSQCYLLTVLWSGAGPHGFTAIVINTLNKINEAFVGLLLSMINFNEGHSFLLSRVAVFQGVVQEPFSLAPCHLSFSFRHELPGAKWKLLNCSSILQPFGELKHGGALPFSSLVEPKARGAQIFHLESFSRSTWSFMKTPHPLTSVSGTLYTFPEELNSALWAA